VLVKTGNGLTALQALSSRDIIPDYIASDLYEAALWIIKNMKN